jgi:hypothetical protein
VRIALHGATTTESWAYNIEHSPTAHIARTQLPDGSTRTVVDDPQQRTHAVILERGDLVRMDVTEPAHKAASSRDNVNFGSVSVREDVHAGVDRTTIQYHRGLDYDLGLLFLASIPMGLIVGTILSDPLAKENDGHLELAWTKPVSRERFAMAAIGVDTLAIAISQLLCIGVVLIATLLFAVPRFSYGEHVGWNIVVGLLAPIAWYAMLTAASSSLKRGPGLVVGMGWLFGIIVPGIAGGLSGATGNAIAAGFYAIFRALSYLDPISYMTFANHNSTIGTGLLGLSMPATTAALAMLSIVYIALSVLQWRRVEA